MYPGTHPGRAPAQTLTLGNQYIPPSYDFGGYHHHHHLHPHVAEPSAAGAWNPAYAPRDDWSSFPSYGFPGSSPGQLNFASPDLSGTPPAGGGGSFPAYNFIPAHDPAAPKKKPFDPGRPGGAGLKTRTKDKYRVVYTDHQRMELEKEFQFNRYITMRRKAELSQALSLSERQVKIWFQNRRAKERKLNRKKQQQQHSQQASTTTPTPPVLGGAMDGPLAPSPGSNILSDTISEEY